MSHDVEEIKKSSNGLRGTIREELADPADHFASETTQLIKFHGMYQQDDRDARKQARDAGGGKDFSFMLRTKSPGGFLPAQLYAAIDRLSDTFGNSTIRVTTRGGLQLHGVRKPNLKTVIATINEELGTTLGACGDINRNVMAPPWPFIDRGYHAARSAASAIAAELTPVTRGYFEIWQDGEKVTQSGPDPIYGDADLPRKFKIAVTVPGDNSVDLYTNDIGLVVITDDAGAVLGYDLVVGGGLGMTHGKKETFPRLADEFAFVPAARMLDAVRAIVIVQRDHGDRQNRRHARMKYLIADRGLAWFREQVESVAGFALEPWLELPAWTVPNFTGWNEQGDGRWFFGLEILSGRIADAQRGRIKTALREIVELTGSDFVATPDQNIIIRDIDAAQREAIDEIFRRNGVQSESSDPFERTAMACPALPTCGLALAESERFLPELLATMSDAWNEAGLNGIAPTVRMTGCPNGCARPSLGEIGIVGVSADRYNVYIGGNPASTRLNVVYRDKVKGAEIVGVLAPLFTAFASERRDGESFGDYCARVHVQQPMQPA